MEVHEVCKRFLHELEREMGEQAEVIDEHVKLVRAHRELLKQKLELRAALLDVQQRRAAVQEELRAAHRVQTVRQWNNVDLPSLLSVLRVLFCRV